MARDLQIGEGTEASERQHRKSVSGSYLCRLIPLKANKKCGLRSVAIAASL
jgi:hypothetical protein